MNDESHRLGFILDSSQITNNIFIPKYYDPDMQAQLEQLSGTHELISMAELAKRGDIKISSGDEIGKMAYGTGLIPFIRTSDISNWEIKADAKQGVSLETYQAYADKQDVKAGDILFVRDGTYLIGESCLVSAHDLPLIYQSHILKFRVTNGVDVSAQLLLAALSCPIVRRQIRAKQFTADIIDSIGNRFLELVLPVPRDEELRKQIEREVKDTVEERVKLRERLMKLPFLAQGTIKSISDILPAEQLDTNPDEGNLGFVLTSKEILGNIFLPRYYDPELSRETKRLSKTHELVTLKQLVEHGTLSSDTGIEVGKMAYGTGPVPFIRTSDISNWELKVDPKQCVSEELYEETRLKLDVQADDILVVRDGTYLVGTSCILTEHDTKIVYCGGIYKIRVEKKHELDPYLLLVLLNTPSVRKQMRSKQFTRDVIDTLGKRIFEIIIPIPKDPRAKEILTQEAREIIKRRVRLRARAKQIAMEIQSAHVRETRQSDG
jgi:hypothetical protein